MENYNNWVKLSQSIIDNMFNILERVPPRMSRILKLASIGLMYLLAVSAGLYFGQPPAGISLIWPASGLALSALLLSERRGWSALLVVILLANLCANWLAGSGFAANLGFSTANCLEAWLAASLLARFAQPLTFRKFSKTLVFFGVVLLSFSLSAVLKGLVAANLVGADFWQTWLPWVFSHVLGALIIVPLTLAWNGHTRSGPGYRKLSRRRPVEGLILLGFLLVTAWLVYLSRLPVRFESLLDAYLILPLLIWAALRFGQRYVTLALMITGLAAVLGTMNGLGNFAPELKIGAYDYLSLQIYLLIMICSTLILKAGLEELHKAGEMVRKSEADYRSLFENALTGIFHALPDGGLLRANQALADMLGYASEDDLSSIKDFSTQIHVDGEKLNELFKRALQQEGWVYTMNHIRRIDGSLMLGRLALRKVMSEDGSLIYLEGFLEDVTDRMRVETELNESEQKFRSIVDTSPTSMQLYRLTPGDDLALEDANPAADQLFGIRHADFFGKTISEILPGMVTKENVEIFKKVARGELDNQFLELQVRDSHLEGIFAVQVFQTNHGFILVDFVDVSERKQAEHIAQVRLRLLEYADDHSQVELLRLTLDEAEALTNSQIGFCHFLEDDQTNLVLLTWSTRTEQIYCKTQGTSAHYPLDKAGVWAECIREGHSVVHNDYNSLPGRKGLPEGHAVLVRELVVPVLRGSKIVCILAMGNKPYEYTERDVSIVETLADLAWDICERIGAEAARKKSENLLNESQANAKVGGWEFEVQNQKMIWTREVYRIHGLGEDFDPNDMEHSNSFYNAKDRPAFERAFELALKQGQPYDLELRFSNSQGVPMWVRTRGTPQLENGQVVRLIGSILDITERKQTEQALAEKEEQFRLAMEASQDGLWDWRPQENISYYSPSYYRQLGYTENDFPPSSNPKKWINLVHPDDQELINGVNADWFTGRAEVSDVEFRLKSKKGSWKWILSRGKVVEWDSQGLPVRITGTHMDITERKQMEDALLKANRSFEKQAAANKLLQALLMEQAMRDELTGLYNRRYMNDALEREILRAEREGQPVSLLMLDVDHFKLFNDTFGHQTGDQVLVALSSLLRLGTRESDIACRYGGEEFVVILPGAGVIDGAHRAERIRQDFCDRHLGDRPELRATVSIGLAVFPQHGANVDDLLRAADDALYVAKNSGRNRACVFEEG